MRRLVFATLLVLVPLIGAASAQADEGAQCPGRVIEQPFTAWGDPADYFLAPDGDFTAGGAGWDLAGAQVVEDNEPHWVHGGDTPAALALDSGASATSPRICVGVGDPTMRFFARSLGGPSGTLSVKVLYTDADGVDRALTIGTVVSDEADGWTPVTPLPITANTYEMRVAFRFTAQGPGSEWQVDDVYVDPYRKG
jgi:hypothetical protein